MGLHISRIEIHNFRNFRHLVIEDFPAHAVIVGENGVGKSNLLEAIRLVLDPTLSETQRLLRDEDIWEGNTAGLAEPVEVSVVIELQGYDDDDDAKSVLSTCTVAYAPYTARLTYRFFARTEITGIDAAVQEVQPTGRLLTAQDYDYVVFGGESESTDVRTVRRYVAWRVLPALRDAEGDLRQWRRSPLRNLLERLPLDPANLEATTSAIDAAVDQLTQDANITRLEQHLTRRLDDMLGPRLAIEPTLGFASSRPDELIRSVRLFIDVARRRGISDTSLGSANVIYLGLLLEALSQQRLDEQSVAALVAVEEPEAHLHVSLQRHLFGYLLRSETSLLLTTHSPHIAAVTPIRSFIVLRATGDGTVGASTAKLPVSDAQAEDLERYIDVSRAEVLFASSVVLVEGLAELYVLPALAAAAGFPLDAYGTVVASVHGTDFAPYQALLGPLGLNTPHAILTDGDAAPDGHGRREAGLRRGAKLHPEVARATALIDSIGQLPDRDADGYTAQRAAVTLALEDIGVFVGAQTLETDLCAVFGNEIVAAFQELSSNTAAIEEVRRGVRNEQGASPADPGTREAMLDRIGALGKGRFAQRLAAHIRTTDLRARIGTVAGIDNPNGPMDAAVLRRLGAAAAIFLALNDISMKVRGTPLLPAHTTSTPAHQDTDAPGH